MKLVCDEHMKQSEQGIQSKVIVYEERFGAASVLG